MAMYVYESVSEGLITKDVTQKLAKMYPLKNDFYITKKKSLPNHKTDIICEHYLGECVCDSCEIHVPVYDV